MAGSKTDAYENRILNTMRGTALNSWTPYLALFTVAPTETSDGTELSLAGYSRQPVVFDVPIDNGAYKEVSNSNSVTFPTLNGSGEVVVAIGYFDALTLGELRYYDDTISPITVNTNTIITASSGDLEIREG